MPAQSSRQASRSCQVLLSSTLSHPNYIEMSSRRTDRVFAGSIPQLYQQSLVPLIFEPYAADLASRVALHQPKDVLEIAAGTGVVTRHLARELSREASIMATDLNQPMLDEAAALDTSRAVEWRQADAMQLPFLDAAFDAVVCQFGVMFFPDKAKAFAEARRVLRPGGHLIFNVWDRIEENEFADSVNQAVGALYPEDPPQFLARVPHGYHDLAVIAADLARSGFLRPPSFTTFAVRSRATAPSIPAIAYCQATPLRSELEARGGSCMNEAISVATTAIAQRFGTGVLDSKIQAHIIIIER
jgi:SAM-dependent methyltransferase